MAEIMKVIGQWIICMAKVLSNGLTVDNIKEDGATISLTEKLKCYYPLEKSNLAFGKTAKGLSGLTQPN